MGFFENWWCSLKFRPSCAFLERFKRTRPHPKPSPPPPPNTLAKNTGQSCMRSDHIKADQHNSSPHPYAGRPYPSHHPRTSKPYLSADRTLRASKPHPSEPADRTCRTVHQSVPITPTDSALIAPADRALAAPCAYCTTRPCLRSSRLVVPAERTHRTSSVPPADRTHRTNSPGMQALCFKGPFDVRLATAPHMTQGRRARQVGEPSATATPVDATQALTATQQEPAQATQPQVLAARPALGVDCNDSSRPMVKKVSTSSAQKALCCQRATCARTSPALTWALSFNVAVCSPPTLQRSPTRRHQRGGHPRKKAPRRFATKRCFLVQPLRMQGLSRWRRSATSRAATSSAWRMAVRMLAGRVLQDCDVEWVARAWLGLS